MPRPGDLVVNPDLYSVDVDLNLHMELSFLSFVK